MNFLDNSAQVERLVQDCPLYHHTTLSPLLLITTFFTHYLTIGFFAVSLYQHELYALLVSFALTVNFFIHHLLQLIAKTPPRFVGCYTEYGSPSLVTQHLLFFDVIVMTYPYFFKRPVRLQIILLVRFFVWFVLFAWVYIGANTTLELAWGALAGITLALLFQTFVWLFVAPYTKYWLSLWICKQVDMIDTLITPLDPPPPQEMAEKT